MSHHLTSGDSFIHNHMDFKELISIARQAAIKAGEAIIEIYESGDFSIEAKSDDSPLTLADKASHNVIVSFLENTDLPILSEEGSAVPYEERKNWEYFWLIDPLDGTKEFIKKNGEFTVNIALVHETKVIAGVVYTPVLKDEYWAIKGEGAFKNGEQISVNSFKLSDDNLKVVASRSHLNDDTQQFMDGLSNPEVVSKGSSLKLLMVAEGDADLYPRYAPTMEWDTAAAQIVVEEAGGTVNQKDTTDSVVYNKENLLNPYFLVAGKI